MRCNKCPLYHSWNNENGAGEECVIFGDGWNDLFQYDNKEGTRVIGCYVDKHYIKKVKAERDKYYERMAQHCTDDARF